METVTYKGREYLVGNDGRLYEAAPIDPVQKRWTTNAMLPAPTHRFKDSDLPEPRMNMEDFPKIPLGHMYFVYEFFAAVYAVHKSEAFVYFHLDAESSEYTVVVPMSQTATAGHVKFDGLVSKFCGECQVGTPYRDQEECAMCGSKDMKDAIIVGTAHSHGSMAAFHSATDDENELDTTGFHITFGHVDKAFFSVAHSFVYAEPPYTDVKGKGTRFKENLPLEDLIDIPFGQERQLIHRWVSLVVSKPGVASLPDDAVILATTSTASNDTTIFTALDDKDTRARLTVLLDADPSIKEVKEYTVSEYKKLAAASNKKTTAQPIGYKHGYTQSTHVNKNAGSNSAVTTTTKMTATPATKGSTSSTTTLTASTLPKATATAVTNAGAAEIFRSGASIVKIPGPGGRVVSVDAEGVIKSSLQKDNAVTSFDDAFDLAYMLNNINDSADTPKFCRGVFFLITQRMMDFADSVDGPAGVVLEDVAVRTGVAISETLAELTVNEEEYVTKKIRTKADHLAWVVLKNRLDTAGLRDSALSPNVDSNYYHMFRYMWVLQRFLVTCDNVGVFNLYDTELLITALLDGGGSLLEGYAVRETKVLETLVEA